MLLTNSDRTKIYEQYAGDYNKYFEERIPSKITLMLNPDSDYVKVFNNIIFNSEVYLEDIEQPQRTLTHIRAYSEHQDSGRIPLLISRSSNVRRKLRAWKADIPRQGRQRMRNPWIFLELEYDNTYNGKFILHDIIVNYTL